MKDIEKKLHQIVLWLKGTVFFKKFVEANSLFHQMVVEKLLVLIRFMDEKTGSLFMTDLFLIVMAQALSSMILATRIFVNSLILANAYASIASPIITFLAIATYLIFNIIVVGGILSIAMSQGYVLDRVISITTRNVEQNELGTRSKFSMQNLFPQWLKGLFKKSYLYNNYDEYSKHMSYFNQLASNIMPEINLSFSGILSAAPVILIFTLRFIFEAVSFDNFEEQFAAKNAEREKLLHEDKHRMTIELHRRRVHEVYINHPNQMHSLQGLMGSRAGDFKNLCTATIEKLNKSLEKNSLLRAYQAIHAFQGSISTIFLNNANVKNNPIIAKINGCISDGILSVELNANQRNSIKGVTLTADHKRVIDNLIKAFKKLENIQVPCGSNITNAFNGIRARQVPGYDLNVNLPMVVYKARAGASAQVAM